MLQVIVGLFTFFRLVVGVSVHDIAQASAAELSPLSLAPEVVVAQQAGIAAEPAQWRAVLHDAPACEFPALEPETNGDPADPDAPSVIRLVFGCTATVTATGQVVRAPAVPHTARFAASSVLARAPPLFAR